MPLLLAPLSLLSCHMSMAVCMPPELVAEWLCGWPGPPATGAGRKFPGLRAQLLVHECVWGKLPQLCLECLASDIPCAGVNECRALATRLAHASLCFVQVNDHIQLVLPVCTQLECVFPASFFLQVLAAA